MAGFIVVVLAAHAYIYYQSLTSYEHVLQQTARIRDKQRWLAHLRLAVDALDATGKEVLDSNDSKEATELLEKRWTELTQLMTRRRHFDADLAEFVGHLQLMAEKEKEVIDGFALANDSNADAAEQHQLCRQTAGKMAAIDRHRIDATASLTELEQLTTARVGSLLHEHGQRLRVYSWIGRLFSLLAFGILVGLMWYGRRLLRVQADILTTRQSALWERRERLAAVGELCSSVAHGIRNPLTSISTSAQLILETEALNAKSTRRIEDILTECRRLGGRVTHLLQFAAEPGERVQEYPFQNALDRAVDEMRSRLERAGIAISCRWSRELSVVRGDPERMVLAILEILTNALDNLKTEGSIELTCARDPSAPQVVVFDYVDNGPGIRIENRTHVFDLFFSTKPGGTGIGLATARRAAELHGGELIIVEHDGPGLHLRMRLPIAAPPAE